MNVNIILLFIIVAVISSQTSSQFVKYTVSNATYRRALCNDGTPAIYYLQKPSSSNGSFWIIYLEGGGYCDSLTSCDSRNRSYNVLMTSDGLPSQLPSFLIPFFLTPDCSLNPIFCNAIKVYIHYCSSDVWAGSGGIQGPWQFNGRFIVKAVFEDLFTFHNLTDSPTTTILYSGSSAGGIGVTHTIDWIKNLFFFKAKFWGFNDAGFMVYYPFFSDPQRSPLTMLQSTVSFWNVTLEGSPCVAQYPNEPWRCILGPYATEASQQPLFTFIALFDREFLFVLGSSSPPNSPESINYTIGYGAAVYSALCNSSKPFFSHSGCVHTTLFSDMIVSVKINGQSLYDTLVDWFLALNRLPHRAIESVDCYCTRKYNCNPTDPCDPGPGYQNGCVYQYCPGFNLPSQPNSSPSPSSPVFSNTSTEIPTLITTIVTVVYFILFEIVL